MASEATKILQAVSAGDRSDDEDVRGLAHAKLHASAPDHTLDPTAVVHEVFIKLIDRQDIDWRSRSQFFAVCARVMRDILVDWDSPGAVSTRSQRAIVILCSFGTPKPASCFGIRIWDPLLEDQRVLRGHTNLRGHEDYVWSLDISADGKRLVSGSGDKTVRIWETWPYSRRIQAIENAKRAAKSER